MSHFVFVFLHDICFLSTSSSLSNASMTSTWYRLNSTSNICSRALACSIDNRSIALSPPLDTHSSTLVFNLLICPPGIPLRRLSVVTSAISTGQYNKTSLADIIPKSKLKHDAQTIYPLRFERNISGLKDQKCSRFV